MKVGQPTHVTDFSTGGLLALGAEGSTNKDHYMGLAADIAHTCHESYDRTGDYCGDIVTLVQ